MPEQRAGINAPESIEHILADRARLQRALRSERATQMSPEKRASLEARLAEVEQRLQDIKAALAGI